MYGRSTNQDDAYPEGEGDMENSKRIHLFVDIELAEDGFASPDEMDVRERLIEMIEERGIGDIGGFGSGMGSMDISVIVTDEETGRAAVIALIRELVPDAKVSIEVFPLDEEETDPKE